ncbi:MAG: pyridoxal phosphate-dependent aminotransferase [Pseudomonadota bacterium]
MVSGKALLRGEFGALEDSGIGKVVRRGFGRPGVFPLWIGEGDRPTPAPIREAAKQALDDGHTFYNIPRGRMELLDALRAYLERIYDVPIDPGRLVVPGSTMLCLNFAAQMVLEPGDHVVVVTPHWPNVLSVLEMAKADITFVRQEAREGHWHLDLGKIEAACRPGTKALYVNSPCNPTGWIMPPSMVRTLLDLGRERGFMIFADEVYHRNVFDGDVAPSFLDVATPDDPVISINGFSKAWAMTGWRLGWLVAPAGLEHQLSAYSTVLNTGATSFAQFGAIAALGDTGEPIVRELRDQYREGFEVVRRRLGQHPKIELREPEGAFYAFPKIKGMTDSLAFCQQLLDEENVGTAPGYTFGPGNEAHVRLCFAMSAERLDEALERLVRFVDRHC